jgi:hypothetical protein
MEEGIHFERRKRRERKRRQEEGENVRHVHYSE